MQGGIVFIIIVILGIFNLFVFLNRLLHLRRALIDYPDFLKGVCNVLEKNNVEEALMLCEETPGPVAAVVHTAILHKDSSLALLTETVSNTARAELSRMERRLASIALSCQIAPLLGLLGTFLGMVVIVSALKEQAPVIRSTDLATGLIHAFASTIAGIIVAIQCHVLYTILITRIERLTLEMEASASEIIAYLTEQEHSINGEKQDVHQK